MSGVDEAGLSLALTSNETIENMIDRLQEGLNILGEDIINYFTQESNNRGVAGIIVSNEATIIKDKSAFLESLIKGVEALQPKELPKSYRQGFEELIAILDDDTIKTNTLLQVEKEQLKASKGELVRVEEQIRQLKESSALRLETGEAREDEDLKRKSIHLDKLFIAHKKLLKKVVDCIFTDDSCIDVVLVKLCEAYFADKGSYINVKPEYGPSVELLLNADVVVHHPYDSTRIKLVEFEDWYEA